ncbi:MAG TPA: hypothetical protein PL158_02735 [Bacillota bacterium]|nr:hypothetical protein [Bacillota bacterium]HOL09287.1 hypothetical protein [Bacillota bacterium]
MNINIKEQKGMALMLVLIGVIMVSATAIAIFAGVKTQGNTTVTMVNSKEALVRAEDGLRMMMAAVNADPANGINILRRGINIPADHPHSNGWQIVVSYNDANNVLSSTATQGRFSKTVAINVNTISISTDDRVPGPGAAVTNEVFANGRLVTQSGLAGNRTDDAFKWMGDYTNFHANGEVDMSGVHDNFKHVNIKSAARDSFGNPVEIDFTGAGNAVDNGEVNLQPGVAKIDFPQVDWSKLKTDKNPVEVTGKDEAELVENLKTKINSMQDTGGWIWVNVPDGMDVVNIDCYNYNIDLKSQPLNIVFYNDNNNFKVKFYESKGNGSNFNGGSTAGLNILSHNGQLEFDKIHFNNPKGVLYSDYESKGSDDWGIKISRHQNTNMKSGGILSNGHVYLDNVNFERTPVYQHDSSSPYQGNNFDFIAGYMYIKVPGKADKTIINVNNTFNNWREINN